MPTTAQKNRLTAMHGVLVMVVALTAILALPSAHATPTRLPSLGYFDVAILGLSATIDPLEPTVPKNTASAVRIVVRAGDKPISKSELEGYLGGTFEVHGELSGPGLSRAITLPVLGPSDPPPDDPLLLALPPLDTAGDYLLSNIRIERGGRALIDAAPASIPIRVIDQILVTSVTTRALTLDEIRDKGIVLDSDDYTGFEFTLGMASSSQTVSFSIPVVFDRQGVAVPQVIEPPPSPPRIGIDVGDEPPAPLILPGLLEVNPEFAEIPEEKVRLPNGQPIRIPSVIVIPGNVGYLKQFFSAQLYVANGAPVGSGLTVRGVSGTVHLPTGVDLELGTADDPLALPETVRGVQSTTMPVKAVGFDGLPATADDVEVLKPTEQGQAEFLIRGEQEGFHSLAFDINAILEGLPVGPVPVTGKAAGGVLVRNPFFDMTFTVPSVVRKGETFSVYATVTNIGQGLANDVHVTLDASRISGATLVGEPTQTVATLRTGDARTLEFKFLSQRTGQVVATYLKLEGAGAGGGSLKFMLGVGERGVALSPDTLVLPSAVDSLPASVVEAAMRVLGQAWSIANAPSGTLPMDVIRVSRSTATSKALALSEAGLRALLGQAPRDALRDLVMDFYAPPLDAGFDQLMRETAAGQDFARVVGAALQTAVSADGGVLPYGHSIDRVASSGGDFVRFGVGARPGDAAVEWSTVDGYGQHTAASAVPGAVATADIPGAFWLPLANNAVFIGTAIDSTRYTLEGVASGSATLDFSVTTPRGGGRFIRAEASGVMVAAGSRIRLLLDLYQPEQLNLELDLEGDGTFETVQALPVNELVPEGPNLVSATIVGPETLAGASPFGTHAAALFDRVVDPSSASVVGSYVIPKNRVISARSQLSGRFVFLSLMQPEGPYIPTSLQVSGIRDARGTVGVSRQVDFGCRLEDPGAVISGRVIAANGDPLTSGTVTYEGNSNWQCLDEEVSNPGLGAVELDGAGRYEFRYVRRDTCGYPWAMATRDPSSGSLRRVTGFVDHAGEQIVLDIAMLGQGKVAGLVRDLEAKPVPLAQVVVVSQTDPQVGGTAMTDGDGRYEIYGITVGPVSVTAAKGSGVGRAAGSVARAGSTAEVDVTLDSGAASLAGRVLVEEGTAVRAVPGINVVFKTGDVPTAVAQTDANGYYRFDSVPAGAFAVEAMLNTRDRARVTGSIAAGAPLSNVDLVITVPVAGGPVVPGLGYGTVKGYVTYSNGNVAPEVIVSMAGRGLLSANDGSFEITGIPVVPGQPQTVTAQSRDGLRSGTAVAYVNQRDQVVSGIYVVLSGLGQAEFTLLSATGAPVVGQEIAMLDRCEGACGCSPRTTDANGKVTFTNLPMGTVHVRAVRPGTSFVDVIDGTASVTRDGETAVATMRFAGSGTVAGTVRDEKGQPIYGADIVLQAPYFDSQRCALISGTAQRVRTNTAGGYRFQAVNLGAISVTASQTFYPTPVGRSATLSQVGDEVTLDMVLSSVSNMAGELSGTVTLPDGKTPAGAGVEVTVAGVLPDVVVNTDAAGHYRYAKILPLGNYQITARDPVTGGVARSSLALQAGQDLQANLRLLGKGTVVVYVVDANGADVEDAYVRLAETSFPNRQFEGAADSANLGHVRFDNVFEGSVSAEVSDVYGRGGRASSYLSGDSSTLELKVSLSITGTVTGRFLQADNSTPVAFGAVKLYAAGRLVGQTTTLGSGNDVGRFLFEHVPAGPVRVEALDPNTGRTGVAVGTINTQDQLVDLSVRSQGLGTVEGFVRSNGQPQPGADVSLVAGSLHAQTMADPDGRYRFSGVPEGAVSVTANIGGGYLSGSASANLVGDGSLLALDVALRDSGAVGGVVLRADGITIAPASRVTLSVGGTGGGTLSALTDSLGHFHFDRVPAGTATVSVDLLGSIDQTATTTTVPAGGTVNLELRLHGVGSLRGVAYDSAGRPTTGSVVIAGTGDLKYSQSVLAAADGSFAIPELLAGPFTASLTVQTATFRLYGSAKGNIVAGQETALAIHVQDTGTIRGCAIRSDSITPALGAVVTVNLLPNRGSYGLYAGSDGCFDASGVPLGAFAVAISDALSGGLAQVDGNSLTSNGQVLELGRINLDDTPIEAVAFNPADGALQVAVQQPIRVTFSDRLASPQGIIVSRGTQNLYASATIASDGVTAILTGTWTDSAEITVTATTAVTDQFGRHPKAPKSVHFRTVDLTPPQVVAITPPNGAIEVAATPLIEVEFSEALGNLTDLAALVALTGPSGRIDGVTQPTAPNRVQFVPGFALVDNASFTLSVNGAVDDSGNRQTVVKTSQFATRDLSPPLLVLKQPAPGTWSQSATPTIIVGLSDALSGVDSATGELSLDGILVEPSRSTTELRFVPTQPLAQGIHPLEATVHDRAGNLGLLQTELRVDSLPPSVPMLAGVASGNILVGPIALSATATDSGSGVARIVVTSDGADVLTLPAPTFAASLSSSAIAEGRHVLSAHAVDVAGNRGPDASAVDVVVNNRPIAVTITAPAEGTRTRGTVTVTASVSEPVERVEFVAAGVTLVDDRAPYAVTMELPGQDGAEVPVSIAVTAFDAIGGTGTASRGIVIDRKPPSVPNAQAIFAEPPDNGKSFVHGDAGSVEAAATVVATNTASGAIANANAASDGAFALSLLGAIGDTVTVVATDAAGNSSNPATIQIRSITTLPPTSVALKYEGLLLDRLGTGVTDLEPDGKRDAIFSMPVALAANITRQLAFIDLEGPTTRSTRLEVGAILGVTLNDLGAPWLNRVDGQVTATLTGSTTVPTVLLFAPAANFIVVGANYRATVAFTNGARYVGTLTMPALPIEEVASAAFSVFNQQLPFPTDGSGEPGALLATETATGTFSVYNQQLPFPVDGAAGTVPGSLLATETASATFSVHNQVLPFPMDGEGGGDPGSLLATETASGTFSLFNQQLPFAVDGPPAAMLATETASGTFSLFNQQLPFALNGPPEALLASETASPTFSLNNDPTAPPTVTESPVTYGALGAVLPVDGSGAPLATDGTSNRAAVGAAIPSLSVEDVQVVENQGKMTFSLALSAATTVEVSVDYRTERATLTPDSEYGELAGTLTIPAGETAQALSIPIHDDTLHEGSETLTLRLSNPLNATLADEQAVGTVTDNDAKSMERPSIFDDFEDGTSHGMKSIELATSGLFARSAGLLSLGGYGIETNDEVVVGGSGIRARARLQFSGASQSFGWDLLSEANIPYFLGFATDATNRRIYAYINGTDPDGTDFSELAEEIALPIGQFADFAIERRKGEVIFTVDAQEVARGTDPSILPAFASIRASDVTSTMKVDWFEVTPASTTNATCLPPHAGLLAWWPAEGTTREVLTGKLGIAETGSDFAPGKVGQAFVFDGAEGVVWAPESQWIAPQEITLAAWVQLASLGSGEWVSTIVAKQATGSATTGANGGEASFALQVDASGHPFLSLYDGLVELRTSSTDAITTNRWHHIAATRRGTAMTIYVDGAITGNGAVESDIIYNDNNGFDVEIGAYLRRSGGRALHGLVDEVMIHERALSADEIRTIYQSGSFGYCLP